MYMVNLTTTTPEFCRIGPVNKFLKWWKGFTQEIDTWATIVDGFLIISFTFLKRSVFDLKGLPSP